MTNARYENELLPTFFTYSKLILNGSYKLRITSVKTCGSPSRNNRASDLRPSRCTFSVQQTLHEYIKNSLFENPNYREYCHYLSLYCFLKEINITRLLSVDLPHRALMYTFDSVFNLGSITSARFTLSNYHFDQSEDVNLVIIF